MVRRRLTTAALAVAIAMGLGSHRAAAASLITSKETLYCELETPNGSSSCLFPVTATKWPSWVPDNLKQGILEMEGLSSDISSLVSGIGAVQSAISTAKTLAAALGLYTPPPSTEQQILEKVEQILAIVQQLRILQQLTYDGLYQQSNQQFIDDARMYAAAANDEYFAAYMLFGAPDPETAYAACLASGVVDCMPFLRGDQPFVTWATNAVRDIDLALSKLDNQNPVDPIWLDNGNPQAFDPRAAASTYLSLVAQELHILSWEVGPQRLPTYFRDRLLRRATFINDILIPGVKDWVHSRCERGPNVPSVSGTPSPLGMRSAQGTYFSSYYRSQGPCGGHYENYRDGTWTKNCDYSSTTTQVYYCYTDPIACGCLQPMPTSLQAANPFYKGDPTEMATLERIGIQNWSYQAANLIGLANGAAYAGCYSRVPTQALLPHVGKSSWSSVAECVKAARDVGDDFAQVLPVEPPTYVGCYTGRGIGTLVRVPDASCDMLSPDGEMLGGSKIPASSVYRVTSSPDTLVASNIVGGKTSYVGCYQPLELVTQTISVGSAEACLQAAVNAKTVYASVEPSGVCRLANTLGSKVALGESACTSTCPAAAGQICGGPGAASVFATNDPMPVACSRGTADCNGLLTCDTKTTVVANCGACGNVCAQSEYCTPDLTCRSTTIKSYNFSLSQAVAFSGTSSTAGSEGAFVPVTGAAMPFSVSSWQEPVTIGLDLFAYKPSGPADMSLDLRFVIDGSERGRTRFRPGAISFAIPLSGLSYVSSHTLRVEVRSVLNSGPPTTLQLYGNYGGAANGCYTYSCGPKPANLFVNAVRK